MNTGQDPSKVELSTDEGRTWELIRVPYNSLPFHQVNLLGRYEENTNIYRRPTTVQT